MSSRGSLEGCGKSVPKLRFPRFAGEWNKYSLNECLSVYCKRNKGRFTKEEVLSVSGEFGIVNQIEFQGRSFAGESITNYKVISPGLLVYTKSPLREAPYGIVKASRTTNGIVSPLYGVYTSSDKVIPCFVEAYFANALRRNRYFKPLVNLGPKHTMCISDEGALAGTITLPEIEEQSRICDFLLVLDSRITAQRRLVELLKKQKRGLSNALFSGKLRLVNDAKWKVYRLGDIVRRVTRKNGTASDVPLTISAQHGLIDQREFFSKSVASANMSGYYLLKQGEFAYNRSSSGDCPFGSIKRLERYAQGAVSTLYICFEAIGDSDDSEFLKWYFDSFAWHREVGMICAEGARNHGLLNVPTEGFFDTKHLLPSDKEERKKMAMFMALEAARCERIECELARLTELKSGFLQQMFA